MLYKIIATVDPSFYYAAFNSSFALRLLWKLWTEKVNFYIHLIALFALLDTTTRNYHWDCPSTFTSISLFSKARVLGHECLFLLGHVQWDS
jgi:hypothetical protein